MATTQRHRDSPGIRHCIGSTRRQLESAVARTLLPDGPLGFAVPGHSRIPMGIEC
jgi:hypothetical protein